jgi:hypothetical protein
MISDPSYLSMAVLGIQPTQLYISCEKLNAVQVSVDFSNFTAIPPIPVKKLNGVLIMTDGHTRAYAAYLAGLEAIPVVWDEDPLDWEAYQICVDWCLAEGIRSIADLQSRVVNAQEYQEKWLDRCRRMQAELVKKRNEGRRFA